MTDRAAGSCILPSSRHLRDRAATSLAQGGRSGRGHRHDGLARLNTKATSMINTYRTADEADRDKAQLDDPAPCRP